MRQPDPWAEIARPAAGYSARRIDPGHPADFFWARDDQGRVALVLQYASSISSAQSRPDLFGVEILEPPESNGTRALLLVLKSQEDTEIFRQLCSDIVEVTRSCPTADGILDAVILRTWKWHRLLRGGPSARLGREEQQGLIGELLVLENLLDEYAGADAVSFWRGPLDEPKDFVVGERAIEVKARHVSRNAVRISSAQQLERVSGQELYLVVVGVAPAAPVTPGAFTLDDLVGRLAARLEIEPAAAVAFESRLGSAGYAPEHDYSDSVWVLVSTVAYRVEAEFPRIEPAELRPGIEEVRYVVLLDACSAFAVPMNSIFTGYRDD
jgi:hypothetical protein